MRPDDYTFVTYRGHNHVLARGTEMTPVMAELLGRQNGLMRGKGGSMHLLDVSHGVLGSYAIIGAQLVIANGTAWSAQYRGSGQVTVCFSATAHQHRRVPRGAEPGCGLGAAGRLRLREQPLHGVHRDRDRDRGEAPRG